MKLSKKITFSLLSIGLSLQVLAPVAAFAETKTDDIVVGQGLLTSSNFETFDDCNDTTKDAVSKTMDKNMDSKKMKDEFPSTKDEDKEGGKAAGIFSKLVNWIAKGFKDVFTVQCGTGFMSYITKISTPVNLTNNPVIMDIMGVTQMIALGSSVIFIAAFGLMYSLGYQNMDPIKFGMRMFVAMVVVYFLPYLLQDILNINNMLVHSISKISIPTSAKDVAVAGAVSSGFALSGIAASVMGALLTLGGSVLAPVWVIVAIAVILFAIYMLTFLVKLILWWYMRMLMIFILAIFGPFFVIMTALPQTAKMSKKWLRAFIGESFSQTFLAVGLYIFINIFMRMGEFNEAVNMGLLGNVFIFYAMLVTLQEFPEFGKSMIGGTSTLGARNVSGAAAAMGAFAANALDHGMKKAQEGIAKKEFQEGIQKQAKIDHGFNKNIDDVLRQEGSAGGRSSSTAGTMGSLAKGGAKLAAGDASGAADMLGADGLMANTLSKNGGNNEEVIGVAAMGMNPLEQSKKSDANEMVKSADTDTLRAIMSSDLSRQETVEKMAEELKAANPDKYGRDQGLASPLAKADADKLLQKVEAKNGMSWEASQQIKKLRQSGDLTQKSAEAVLRKDVENNPALYAGIYGTDNEKELNRNAMNDFIAKHGDVVDDKSVRETTQVKQLPRMQVGDVKLQGGARKYSDLDSRNGTDWTGTAMHTVDNQSMIQGGEERRENYAAKADEALRRQEGGGGSNPPGGGGNNGDGPRPMTGGSSPHVARMQNDMRISDEIEARTEQANRQDAIRAEKEQIAETNYNNMRNEREDARVERRDNNPKFDHLKDNGDDRNFSDPTVETSAPSNSESNGPTVEGKAPIGNDHLDTQSFDNLSSELQEDQSSTRFEKEDRTTSTNFNSFADDSSSTDGFNSPSFDSNDYNGSTVERSEPSSYGQSSENNSFGFSGPSFESSDSTTSEEIELDDYNSSTIERSEPSNSGSNSFGFSGPSVERSEPTGPSSYGGSVDDNDIEIDNSYSSNRSEPSGYGFSGPSFEPSDSTVSEEIELDNSYPSTTERSQYNGPSGYSTYGQGSTDLDSFEIGESSVEQSEPTGPSNYSSAPEPNETFGSSSGFSTYGQNATNLDSFEIGGSSNENSTSSKNDTPRENQSKNFFDEMMGENRKPIQDNDNPFNRK